MATTGRDADRILDQDSDVDGLWDGSTVGAHVGEASVGTNPKNPDSDGDGLRDGQETAGWTVGIWFERTMEKLDLAGPKKAYRS